MRKILGHLIGVDPNETEPISFKGMKPSTSPGKFNRIAFPKNQPFSEK